MKAQKVRRNVDQDNDCEENREIPGDEPDGPGRGEDYEPERIESRGEHRARLAETGPALRTVPGRESIELQCASRP